MCRMIGGMDADTAIEVLQTELTRADEIPGDPAGNPFRTVVDPMMRLRLKQALFHLIDNHDRSLERFIADGQLELSSYKEYIELFARCLRETMETAEGVAYMMESCGFKVPPEEINLYPEWRWHDKAPAGE